MIELPKRKSGEKEKNTIYEEIENFEDYEYTNCIAYEMAIRNKEVIAIKKQIQDYIHTVRNRINDYFEKIGKMRHKEYLEKCDINPELEKLIVLKMFTNINDSYNFPNEIKEYFRKQPEYKKILELNNTLLKKYWIRYYYDEHIESYMYTDDDNLHIEQVNNFYSITRKHSFFQKLLKEYGITKANDKFDIGTKTVYRPDTPINEIDDWIPTVKQNDKELDLLKIFDIKKHMRLIVPKEYDRSFNLKVTLSLPKKELIAYISKIKDDYDKNNSIIKTPLELLGEDLEKSNNSQVQKKPKAQKYADWFYIYDCYQILKQNNQSKSNDTIYNEIDLLLLEHYNSTKEDYYSLETYKKTIMKNMKYLIEELGYKELITGVKNN